MNLEEKAKAFYELECRKGEAARQKLSNYPFWTWDELPHDLKEIYLRSVEFYEEKALKIDKDARRAKARLLD
jgi:hypothetical protein